MTTETTITDDDGHGDLATFHVLIMSPEGFASHPLPSSGVLTIGRSSRSVVQIDDPMASREHARIHVTSTDGLLRLAIEDVGSANGTQVRDTSIARGDLVPISLGEAVLISSTVVMVLHSRSYSGARRLWSHAHFEMRVEDECARSARSKTEFALARIRFPTATAWAKVLPLFATELPSPNVLAKYGPRDYEILFVDMNTIEVDSVVRRLAEGCRKAGLETQWGVAWFPRSGRSGDALLAAANTLLRTPQPIGDSRVAPMARVRALATRAAPSPINLLILGENGVGKDVLAQLVHGLSPRKEKPFVAINCASLTETLMDSELFGHDKGSFTGAVGAHVGLLESASGGTVFLDEIGDMPKSMQAKLLRVIETHEVKPVGATRTRTIDVRFISATNKDLDAATRVDEFRLDLFHRLNGMTLTIPPLRDRLDEIIPLATSFVEAACREMRREGTLSLSDEVVECLLHYPWPGNIRELKNVMERAVVLCDGPMIEIDHLPTEKMGGILSPLVTQSAPEEVIVPMAAITQNLPRLADPDQEIERRRIVDALVYSNGNQTQAARHIGMARRTFVSKLDFYGIPRPMKGRRTDDSASTMTYMKAADTNDGTRR